MLDPETVSEPVTAILPVIKRLPVISVGESPVKITEPLTSKSPPTESGLPPNRDPDMTTSPPKTEVPLVAVPLEPAVPDTKKFVSG